jgi:WD40 repeat protein/predicted Ser/Thr protein kinase
MKDVPPLGTDVSPAQLARRIDRLCDRFEAAWKKGRRPRLERYLAYVPAEAQPELIRELLVLEFEYRLENGERPELPEYHRRFPQHAALLDALLSEGAEGTTPSPHLLGKWAANRLVSQLRLLTLPNEERPGAPADVLSLLARIVSRTAGGNSRTVGEAALASGGLEPPAKLLQPGNADAATTAEAETKLDNGRPVVRVLGDYELLSQLGKGGMGVVYRARQRSTNRIVALKVIRSDQLELLTSEERQEWFERFRREGQMAACLEHDHLVTIYEVGKIAGDHFYSMRFVEGQSLAEILRGGPIPNHRSALYLEQIAHALHALHLRGIVHRDLKPRNILVDTSGRPFLTDFGLAKCSAYTRDLTHVGACVGTPEYMAPEQAYNPAAVQAASDIYSLGATLYEMLTARPPFRAADPVETLRQVRDEEPSSPRRLNPAIHRDLELICLRCLQKEPQKRYADALQVAEELRRYRTGEPLRHTRPVGQMERILRWCRRKPSQAAAAGFAALVLMAVTALTISLAFVAQLRVEKEQKERLSAFEQGRTLCAKEGDVARGLPWLAHSLELAPHAGPYLDNLIRTNLTNWSRSLSPLTVVLPHDKQVRAVAFSPDGKTIITVTWVKLQLWEAATGRPIGQPLDVSKPTVLAAALSPDGKTILAGRSDNTARLWDIATLRPIGPIFRHGGMVLAVAFSPDGRSVITGSLDGTARLWDVASGQAIRPPLEHKNRVEAVAFSPNGKTVLTGSGEYGKWGEARVWDVKTGTLLGLVQHEKPVKAVAFSPDGKAAFTASDGGTARLWDAVDGQLAREAYRLQEDVTAVAFSPDGKMFLTGTNDKTAQLWDVSSKVPVGPRLHHQDRITSVAISPDGKFLITASGSEDSTVRLWRSAPTESHLLSLDHQAEIHAAIFSPDGKLVATGCGDGTVQIWDVATGNTRGPCLKHEKFVGAAAFSPDGKTLLTGSADKTARLWDVATGTLQHLLNVQKDVSAVVFSPDGRTVLTSCVDGKGTVLFWDAASGQRIGQLCHGSEVFCLAFSPDGKIVVSGGFDGTAPEGSSDGTARVWDAAARKPISPPFLHKGLVHMAIFRSDSRFLLTADDDGTVQLWDAITGAPRGPPLKHPGSVYAVAFSPDESLILTGSEDSACLWEAETGKLRAALQHQGAVTSVAFSRDGRLVLTGSHDKTARFWDTATGRQCGPALHHPGKIARAVFSPLDGKTVLTWGPNKTARLWNVPVPVEGAVERVVLWTKVITGMELVELDGTGAVHVMDAQSWHQCRQRLEELGGPPARTSATSGKVPGG